MTHNLKFPAHWLQPTFSSFTSQNWSTHYFFHSPILFHLQISKHPIIIVQNTPNFHQSKFYPHKAPPLIVLLDSTFVIVLSYHLALETLIFFFFLVTNFELRCNWDLTLCKFKAYSLFIWYTYISQNDYPYPVS